MGQGLQVFSADGTLRNDVTDQLTRVIGQVQVSGKGSLPWPYPALPGQRAVSTVSTKPLADNDITTAYSYYDPSSGVVYYSQGDDKGPIILLFMLY